MDAQLEKIREVQKESWNNSSRGWKKWDEQTMRFMKPVGDEMIHMLNLRDRDRVLDVATGTGEPGLTIASMLKNGLVTGTDLAEEMLNVAKEHASIRKLNNYETVCCDAGDLPFEQNSFDAITCRFGLMFFPDLEISLDQLYRVLKPNGKIAVSFWNLPEKNSWITTSMEVMVDLLQLKTPPPGAPGPFRCSPPGMMKELFTKTGFGNIREKTIEGKMTHDSLERYWNFISEVASPLAYSKASESLQHLIKETLMHRVKNQFPNGIISFDFSATVLYGEKPNR